MAESFGVTKDSIQIPYRRFLSDSATGFAAILVGIGAYYLSIFTEKPLREMVGGGVGQEVKVFTMLLLFILATPIGFAVNATSWVALGQALAGVERLCARLAVSQRNLIIFPIWDVAESRCAAFVRNDLDERGMRFDHLASLARHSLEIPSLARLSPETQIRGLVIFLRNISFFLLLIGMAQVALNPGTAMWALVTLSAVGLGCLILRWGAIAKYSKTLAVVLAILVLIGCGVLIRTGPIVFNATVAWCLAGSLAVVTLAGVIGYYNGCDVLLHLYLAAAALGATSPRLEGDKAHEALLMVTRMVRRASERSS